MTDSMVGACKSYFGLRPASEEAPAQKLREFAGELKELSVQGRLDIASGLHRAGLLSAKGMEKEQATAGDLVAGKGY